MKLATCEVCDVDARHATLKRCPHCEDGTEFCAMCSLRCPDCEETVCHDHFDMKRKRCTPCEEARRISSGIARAEWERYGYDD